MLPTQARSALGKELVHKYYEDEGTRVMAPVTKFLDRHGVTAKCSWKTGKPGEMIAKLADDGKFDPVSYTHLDVYKRQSLYLACTRSVHP